MASSDFQCSEVSVSIKKFKKELETFNKIQDMWRSRGVFLIYEQFPDLDFIFVTPNLKPPSLLFCVRINFTNYDVFPPSLKFIEPFTKAPVRRADIQIKFNQLILPENFDPNAFPPMMVQPPQDLLQGLPDQPPFLCIPGTREYHNHPRHTGDSWFLYRAKGEGKLGFILDQLYKHSTAQVIGHNVILQPVIQFKQEIKL